MRKAVETKPFLATLVTALLVFAAAWGLRELGALQFFELYAYDRQLGALSPVASAEPRVTLVEITEEDIQQLGRWPVSDDQLTDALEHIQALGPRMIGVDLYRDVPVPPGTDRLNAWLGASDDIVVVMKYPDEEGRGVQPPAALRETQHVGFNDVVTDIDGIVRRALIFADDGDTTGYSFALRLALGYLAGEGVRPESDSRDDRVMRLGKAVITPIESNFSGYVNADARGYQFLMDYAGGARPFIRVRLKDILEGTVDAERVRGRIVILGTDAISVKDRFQVPRGLATAGADGAVPGIAIHAYIADQLVRAALAGDEPVRAWSDLLEYAWILAWCVLGAFAGQRVRSAQHLVLLGLLGLAAIIIFAFVAFRARLWIPTVPAGAVWLIAIAGITGYRVHAERAERATLMQLFSKHVSPEVAETIWAHRSELLQGGRLAGRDLTATVMFLDFAGFTAASETLGPQALMQWLGLATDRMSRLVMKHAGVIDDYFGDGIKANFGVPVARSTESGVAEDAQNAVRCALAMQEALRELNDAWERDGLPKAALRIGIATGPVVAGSVGSSERMKYTTVGDTVNVAARLESLDRERFAAGSAETLCRILISAETNRWVSGLVEAELLGPVALKGKEQEMVVYRVLALKAPLQEAVT